MRHLLLRLVVSVPVLAAVWIFGGAAISSILDRLFTVAERTRLPGAIPPGGTTIGEMTIADHEMSFAGRRWLLGREWVVTTNARGEVTLASAGHTFTFAATEGGYDGTPGAYYRFHPASADRVTFTTRRSWLAWPLLDRFSIMGAPRPAWQRHLYHRLHWHQQSGATLDMEWRDEQQFYAKSGWSDMFLESSPKVTIGSVSH